MIDLWCLIVYGSCSIEEVITCTAIVTYVSSIDLKVVTCNIGFSTEGYLTKDFPCSRWFEVATSKDIVIRTCGSCSCSYSLEATLNGNYSILRELRVFINDH